MIIKIAEVQMEVEEKKFLKMAISAQVAQVLLTFLPKTACFSCAARIHWVGFNNLDPAWT